MNAINGSGGNSSPQKVKASGKWKERIEAFIERCKLAIKRLLNALNGAIANTGYLNKQVYSQYLKAVGSVHLPESAIGQYRESMNASSTFNEADDAIKKLEEVIEDTKDDKEGRMIIKRNDFTRAIDKCLKQLGILDKAKRDAQGNQEEMADISFRIGMTQRTLRMVTMVLKQVKIMRKKGDDTFTQYLNPKTAYESFIGFCDDMMIYEM